MTAARAWPALAVPLLLTAVAAWIRLARLDLVSITQDEGIHGSFATNISLFLFDLWPQVGLPSVGIRNSAFFVYFLALPNLAFRHPLSGAAFIAGLNALCVWWTWSLARRWHGPVAAAAAAALLALSPWAVLYARNMWPPSALMPFCLLLLADGLSWVACGCRRKLFRLGLLAMLLPQVHFSGFCGPVWVAATVFAGRGQLRRGRWLALAAGLLLGLLTWWPWLSWQHHANHWTDINALAANARGKPDYSPYRLFDFYRSLLHAGRLDYWFQAPPEPIPETAAQALRDQLTLAICPEILAALPPWVPALQPWLGAGMAAAFLAAAWDAARRGTTQDRLLLLWSLLPLLLLAALRPKVHPQYEWIAFPGPFLLLGRWLAGLSGWRFRAAAAGLLLTLACHAAILDAGWRYLDADRPDGKARFELTYRQRRAAAAFMADRSPAIRRDIAGMFSGQQPAYFYPYVHEMAIRPPRHKPLDPVRFYFVDEGTGDALPDGAAKVLATFPPRRVRIKVLERHQVGPTRVFLLQGDALDLAR